jgi:heterotetrameric sarcosine oxidase gamma subunit
MPNSSTEVMRAALSVRSPLENLATGLAAESGVVITEQTGLEMASIVARRSQRAMLEGCMRRAFGVEMPCGPQRVTTEGIAFIGTGMDSWLMTSSQGTNRSISLLRQMIGGYAAIADQSSAYIVITLTGNLIRQSLAKLLPIDLHPRTFGVGQAASTAIGHAPSRIWRVEDSALGVPAFELATSRSYAANVWHAVAECAAGESAK